MINAKLNNLYKNRCTCPQDEEDFYSMDRMYVECKIWVTLNKYCHRHRGLIKILSDREINLYVKEPNTNSLIELHDLKSLEMMYLNKALDKQIKPFKSRLSFI